MRQLGEISHWDIARFFGKDTAVPTTIPINNSHAATSGYLELESQTDGTSKMSIRILPNHLHPVSFVVIVRDSNGERILLKDTNNGTVRMSPQEWQSVKDRAWKWELIDREVRYA